MEERAPGLNSQLGRSKEEGRGTHAPHLTLSIAQAKPQKELKPSDKLSLEMPPTEFENWEREAIN